MFKTNDKRGLMIFGVLVLAFLILSIAAYMTSGNMDIEERFNNAVGFHADSEEGPSGILGFNIEGNLVSYVTITSALVIICAVLYSRSKL